MRLLGERGYDGSAFLLDRSTLFSMVSQLALLLQDTGSILPRYRCEGPPSCSRTWKIDSLRRE